MILILFLGTPFLPALQHYLASVTSIQLDRLTLVRVGIANIYLGSPTNATLTSSNGQSSGEVRLKINASAKTSHSRKPERRRRRGHGSAHEIGRIAMVIRRLVDMAEIDDW